MSATLIVLCSVEPGASGLQRLLHVPTQNAQHNTAQHSAAAVVTATPVQAHSTLTHPSPHACRIVLVAVGSLVGGVALRPGTPLTAALIAIVMILGMTLIADAAYAWGWLPAGVVHARPLLMYADGKASAAYIA
jgi:hypothetical protein